MKITLGILLSALAAGDASAQWNVARFDSETERNRVYTTFGLDPALIGSLGYARLLRVMGHDFQVAGEAGVVTARWGTDDFRTKLGVQTSLVRWRSMHLTGRANFITRGTENAIYKGFNFGADATGALGMYRPRWFAAGEFGFDKAIVTHMTHTDWYRRYVYPDAKDGWYLTTGGTYHYGLASGVALGRAELSARAGWLRTERFNRPVSPVYATVGLGFGF